MSNTKKLGLWTLVMLIFVPTFGFGNITTNAVALGPAAIPSWLIVSLLFFLPLSGIIAELASANNGKEGGIYTWIESCIGPNWAYIGTWSYFIANLFYLQMIFSRIPVMVSWAIFGENRFTDSNAYILPYIAIAIALILTWIAAKGVKTFSKLSDFGGKFTLAVTIIFIVFAILGVIVGKPSATQFTTSTVVPKFDIDYFSTFSWLLFAVAGAEVAGTYIKDVDNPKKTFPKAVIIATVFVALSYIIGSLAVCFVASPDAIQKAGLKDASYVVYKLLAQQWGLNGKIMIQIYALILTLTSIAAYVVWMESPIRAMFSEVPAGTFPKVLTKKSEDGTLKNALWIQFVIVFILIIVPAVGLKSVEKLFETMNNLSSLSLMVPYIILAAAYFVYRLRGNKAPYTMFKSNGLALFVAAVVFILGVAGFIGAGISDVVSAESVSAAMMSVGKLYGGPVALIILGYVLTLLTKAFNKATNKTESM